MIDNGDTPLASDGRRQVKLAKTNLTTPRVFGQRLEEVVTGLCRAIPELGARLQAALAGSPSTASDVCELHLVFFDSDCGGPPTSEGGRHTCSGGAGCPVEGIPPQALHVDYRLSWRDAVKDLSDPAALKRVPFFLVAPACKASTLSLNVAGRLNCLGTDCKRQHKHLPSAGPHAAVTELCMDSLSAIVCVGDLEHAGGPGTTLLRQPRLHVGVCPKEFGRHMHTNVDQSFLLTQDGGAYVVEHSTRFVGGTVASPS